MTIAFFVTVSSVIAYLAFNKPGSSAEAESALGQNWQFGFQNPASPISEGMVLFHNDLRIFLTAILFFVIYLLNASITRFGFKSKDQVSARLTHASKLEIIWTIIPALILTLIARPSFSLLYSVDEIIEPAFTFKVIGHQWYWSYEFLDPVVISALYNKSNNAELVVSEDNKSGFDSFRLSDAELNKRDSWGLTDWRLLSTDNQLALPAESHIRARITSADVLHSWAVPALGIKLDACPGRLNQASLYINREGFYYGQCSEICGVYHGFRPIGIICLDLFAGFGDAASAVDFEPVFAFLQGTVNG